MRPIRFVLFAAGAALMLSPRSIQAAVPGYTIQTLAKAGDTIGGVKIRSSGDFEVGAMNDSGQIAFLTENAAGGEMLFQYSAGQFIPIAVGGKAVSGVKWPSGIIIYGGMQINKQGDITFATQSSPNNSYRWDHQSWQATLMATAGTPAVNDLTFTSSADQSSPAINDAGEVAFQARVKDSAGTAQRAIFFQGHDNKLVPVALSGQMVDGVGTIQPDSQGGPRMLSNGGVLSFQARRAGDKSDSVFLWQNGTITPVLLPGADAPGGGKFALVGGALLNNKNSNVFIGGNLDGNSSHWGLYMWTGGRLVAICPAGQAMPGGGQFVGLANFSYPNSAGESAFTARLDGGDSGVYRVDADGKLSLVVKSSDLGGKFIFSNAGSGGSYGIGINGQGQITLPVRFTGNTFDSLIMLTPASP